MILEDVRNFGGGFEPPPRYATVIRYSERTIIVSEDSSLLEFDTASLCNYMS